VPLTQSGRFPVYAALCVVSLVFGFLRRAWLARASIAVLALLAVWTTSDFFKGLFTRERPHGQLVFHEASFGYASSHAALALTFYGIWALFAWRSGLPRPLRSAFGGAAAVLVAAIGWSRLALGAHYLSDVIGGYLLGATFVCIVAAAVRRQSEVRPTPVTVEVRGRR